MNMTERFLRVWCESAVATRARRAIVTARLTLTLAALFAVASTDALPGQERGEIGIAVGERPELVEIEDLDGNPLSLTRYVGEKPVLIEFWARWCENCRELLPQMRDVYARYGDRIEIVAISVAVAQSRRSVRRHLEKEPVDYPTIWDTKGRATRAFLAPATSYIVILDTSGRVVYTGIGPGQEIEAAVLGALESAR